MSAGHEFAKQIQHVRQRRLFTGARITDAQLNDLLEIARWSGSGGNSQPWQFIVIDDPEQLKNLAALQPQAAWVANAAVAIAPVMAGAQQVSERFDEGRLAERLLIGAHGLGLGAGVSWFLTTDVQEAAKEILNVPAERGLHEVIAIGHVSAGGAPKSENGGRKPLSELVFRNRLS